MVKLLNKLSEKVVKSRKEYTCHECYNKIKKGDLYNSTYWESDDPGDGKSYPWKQCLKCYEVLKC